MTFLSGEPSLDTLRRLRAELLLSGRSRAWLRYGPDHSVSLYALPFEVFWHRGGALWRWNGPSVMGEPGERRFFLNGELCCTIGCILCNYEAEVPRSRVDG